MLTGLPESFGSISSLMLLNLSNSKIESLPKSFGNLNSLCVLDLECSELKYLPESFGGLSEMVALLLNENKLSSLPNSFGSLASLRLLDICSNKLTGLPNNFGSLSQLEILCARDNLLTGLPNNFGDLSQLYYLDIRSNKITEFPSSFGSLVQMKTFHINENPVTSLPDSFGNLVGLRSLDLSRMSLRSLPESFGSLVLLSDLSLGQNRLTSLSPSFFKLNLDYLDLFDNKLTSVPAELGSLKSLYYLNVSRNELTSIPDTLKKLTQLEYLDLSHNKLGSLPDVFYSLPSLSLSNFAFSHNSLSTVPSSFAKWFQSSVYSQESLDLSYQNFNEFPSVLNEYPYLYYVYMKYNKVKTFPKAGVIFETINLEHNNMTSVPEGLANSSVRNLYLSSNWLTTLENLPRNLKYLDFSENYIRKIPEKSVYRLPSIVGLDENYLVCSQYNGFRWESVRRYCKQDRQYSCSDKTLTKCEELRDKHGICTPNSEGTACLGCTDGVREFCGFAKAAGIEGCVDIYPDGICNGSSEFHGFVYDCDTDYVTEYRPKNMSDFFTEVPDSVQNLTKLKTLTFSGLNLTTIPKSYAKFSKVVRLNLTYNKFTSIPDVAYDFKDLEFFDISHNKFRTLPDAFFKEKDLYLFYAHHNYLKYINNATYYELKSVEYVDIDYNFLDCYASTYSYYHCTSYRQFVCSEVDKEGCTPKISGKCAYDNKKGECAEYSNKKTVAITVVVIIVVAIVLGILFLKFRQCRRKMANNEAANLIINNNMEREEEDTYFRVNDYKHPEISLTFVVGNKPGDAPPAAPAFAHTSPISNFYGPTHPGLNSIPGLFSSDEHMKRRDLLDVLQQAGCNVSEGQGIIQDVVIWAGKLSFDRPFTAHDAEVLGVYTYNYGDKLRSKSPAFKLCYAMNMLDEPGIRSHKDFLYLMLTSLRRLPLKKFKERLYFAMALANASQADFPAGRMFKIMPFLTLFSSKSIALSTLEGASGVVFGVSVADGYDISKYSMANPGSYNTTEVIMEPESVFMIENFQKASKDVAEVSLMYVSNNSEFPLSDIIGNDNSIPENQYYYGGSNYY